jgi:hypothetical protein
MKLGLAGEGVDQRVGLASHQTGEVRHSDKLLTPPVL